jgi:hypothetical protein
MGGAVNASRTPTRRSRAAARGFTFNLTSATEGPRASTRSAQWTRDFWSALAPHQMGVYVNFLMEEGRSGPRGLRRGEVRPAKALKRKYDPENLFRLNQNVPPD